MNRRRSRSEASNRRYVAVGAGGGLEQSDLFVVADRSGRQAGLGRDLLDPQEGALGRGARGLRWHPPMIPQP